MAKKDNVVLNYKQGITRTDSEIKDDSLNFTVEQAKNNLALGILSVKGKVLTKQSDVATIKSRLANAENLLNKSTYAVPFDVQSIITHRKNMLQAQLDVEVAIEELDQYNETLAYLENLDKTLF